MITMDKNQRINGKLRQFEVAIRENKSNNKFYLEYIVGQLGSLNNQITETNYLKVHHSEWIGSTALHIAHFKNDLKVFHLLLSFGADYNLKNKNGFTVLHSVLESVNKDLHSCSKWIGRLDNLFITAILSAHVKYQQASNPRDPNGFSHFHAACMTNNVEAVEFFLDNGVSLHDGVDVNSNHFPGYTPLHLAVRHFSFQVVEILLKHGASTNLKDAEGMTPMLVLLKRNFEMVDRSSDLQSIFQQERALSEKIARTLLDKIATKDTLVIDDSDLSSLHISSALMDLSAVVQILEKVTNVNHCVNVESPLCAGYTALHFAAFFNINIVKLLVRRGADLQVKDARGVTPLDLCLERYKVENIHSILSLKTEFKDITFSDGRTKLLGLISATKSYKQFDKFLKRVAKSKIITLLNDSPLWPGFTLLHLVVLLAKSIGNHYDSQSKLAHKTYLQMISVLFKKNPKYIETQDIHGFTPLHVCFRSGNMTSVVDLLMTLHQKLDSPLDLADKNDLSLLHIACAEMDENFVEKLVPHSNDTNRTYKGEPIRGQVLPGWTPLHIAVVQKQYSYFYNKKQSKKVINALLSHGANVNAKDAHEITPVHLLAILKYVHGYETDESIASVLLSSPHLEVGVAEDIGLSHLHVASYYGDRELVKKLIDNGANVNGMIKSIPEIYRNIDPYWSYSNSIEYENNTTLHIASKSRLGGRLMGLLIERGADIFAKNSKDIPLLCEVLGNELSDLDVLDAFMTALVENANLKNKVEKDIGLTLLHIACRVKEPRLVKHLLDNGADVNAQISSDSIIWPGYTPLHVLARYANNFYVDEDANHILKLLLDREADVALQNKERQTPIHMAYKYCTGDMYIIDVYKSMIQRLIMMLRSIKDFSVNPMSIEGITHFHIACTFSQVLTVKQFLKYENVDVDQPIDFFKDFGHSMISFPDAGCTPLHLAVKGRTQNYVREEDCDELLMSKLVIIDLLLQHGANANVKDAWGRTPFHIADCTEIRERLARGGANVNLKDAVGQTPFEVLLSNGTALFNDTKDLLRCGCHYNAFNTEKEIGLIGLSMRSLTIAGVQRLVSLVSMAMINFPDLMINEVGRSVIHNVVSVDQLDISSDAYTTAIEQLTRIGCDVDAQDKLGRTALHIAVKFNNLSAIPGLLLAGADINVADVNDRTAMAHPFHPCARCDQPTDAEDEQCVHYKVFKLLALHVKKLQYCGLDVHTMIEEIITTAYPSFNNLNVNAQFIRELGELKNTKIGYYTITLHDFMSELDVIADYSTMSVIKRNIIDTYFSLDEIDREVREKFSEVSGLLKLQYRKAVKRMDLLEEAKVSLDFLAGTRVPELCSRIILRFLTNSELESMVNACESTKQNMS